MLWLSAAVERLIAVIIASVHTVTAKREIILSAGAFNTPQILLLSGIGDRTELTKLGIDTVLDLPSVGKNMSDHPFVPNVWSVNSNDTFQRHTAAAVLPAELALWNATGAGPLSWTLMNHVAWLRLPENDPIFKNYTDPSNGPTSAHHELLFSVRMFTTPHLSPGSSPSRRTEWVRSAWGSSAW